MGIYLRLSLAMALLDGIPVEAVWVVGDIVKVDGFPKNSPWLSKDCSNSAAEVSVGIQKYRIYQHVVSDLGSTGTPLQ